MTDRSRRPRAAAALELLSIATFFGLLVLLVDPRGNFPLNDDWDFAKAAWALAETGEFRFTAYTAASVRLQAVWGALWTSLFGASYEVLRASTLVLALATLLLLDRLLARLAVPRPVRLLAVAALLVHPIWFWSSFTFMTHVPAIFMSLLALGAFAEAIRRDDLRMTAAGAVATVGSYFIRQTGVVNSVAALAMFLLVRERISPRWRRHAAIAAIPTLLFAVLFLTTDVLGGSDGELRRHYKFLAEETFGGVGLAKMLVNYSLFSWMEVGLFLAPLSGIALVALARGRRAHRVLFGFVAAAFVARAAYLAAIGLPMPFYSRVLRSDVFGGNIFVNWGLGPLTLSDTWRMDLPYPFAIGYGWRVALTFVAAALGAAALAWCVRASFRAMDGPATRFLVPFLGIHLLVADAALGLSYMYTDRYGLDAHWAVVILFALTLPVSRAAARGAALAVLLVALFSGGAVAEYLEWNRARWAATEWLQARGVASEMIDAGTEYTMHTRAHVGDPRHRAGFPVPEAFRVTFHPLPGYRELHRVPYRRWFGLARGNLFVLEKSAGTGTPRPRR